MPYIGGMRVDPKIGNECSSVHCRWATNFIDHLLHCKAVGGSTVYLTLCRDCYKFIQAHLEVTILLLHIDKNEAIVGQVMNE